MSVAFPVVLSALLGGLLLYLAVPRTIAAWAALEAQPPLEKLQDGKSPSAEELVRGVAGLQQALTWLPSARLSTDLALLELAQATSLPIDDPARKRLLAESEQRLLVGLSENPANGFAWFRLALVRELSEASPRQIAAALAQSLDMAPNARKLWLPRAAMLLAYWRYLTPDELPAMRAQLRTIWTAHEAFRLPLLQEADRLGQRLMLLWALGDDKATLQELESLEKRVPPPSRAK